MPTAPFYANTGSRLSIPASVQGTAPFTFQWQLNGSPIPGQTSATLDFTPTTTNDAGNLSLVVANAAGQATFLFGRLIVAPVGPGQPDLSYRPQSPGTVQAMAIDRDGSVLYGGPFFSQLETYAGVRKTLVDGTVDSSFITGAVIGSGSGPGLSQGTPRALLPLGNGSVLVGAADTSANARYYRRLLADGSQDTSWPWPQEIAGGPRKIAQLPDGKFLMAGGSTGGIHRLNADGSFDNTFLGPTSIGSFQSDYVSDFAVMPDGGILIVGKFTLVDGETRRSIARLHPSGALDTGWIPASISDSVFSVAIQTDGRILLGGNFTTVGNQPYRALARLNADGTLDASVGPILPNGSVVNTLETQPDGKVWVGGQFAGVQGRNHLIRINANGTVDTNAPNPGLPAALASSINLLRFTTDGRLWIGGGNLPIAGQTSANLARFFTDWTGPTIGYAGVDQSPDVGTSITLRGTTSGSFNTVQWRFQGNPVPGATGLELPLANLTTAASGLYDLVVASAGGAHTSAPVSVRVRGPVVIDQPPLPRVVALSNAANFSVTAFGKLPLSYQWFRDGVAVPNATGRTLSLTNLSLSASADYSVRVTAGDGSSAEGGPAYLAVVPAPGSTNASFRPALSTTTTFTTFRDIAFLPNGQAIVGGNFSTTGTGGPNAFLTRLNTDGTVDSTFQFNAAGISDFGAVERQPDGRLVVLLRLSTAPSPFIIRRLLADGSVDSGFVETEVFYGSDLRLHPDGGVLVVGSSGIERRNGDGSVDAGFKQRATMNGQALSVDVDPSGRIYVAGFFSTVGGVQRPGLARLLANGTVDSAFVPTQVLSSTRVVTALPDGALVGDQSAFFRFTESGARDLAYAWATRLNAWDILPTQQLIGLLNGSEGNGVIRSANGMPGRPFATMKVPRSFNGYSWVRVSPDGSIWLANGSVGTATDPATLLFRLSGLVTPLSILLQPQPQAVLPGGEARLQISASGTSAIRYQWQLNGQDLPGETNSVLVLRNVQAPNVGDYSVRITNASGSLTSQPARVSLIVPPVIAANPTSLVLSEGESAQLSVTAVGVQLRYQWLASATNLPGQTNATLILSNVGPARAGPYFVRVTNPAGTNDSLVAKIRIRPQPATGVGAGPANGLVRRWRFENNLTESVSGLTTIPYGTLTYGTGIESASALKVRSGQNWIQMGDGPGVASRLTDELFTVSFWIKPESEGTINPFSYLMLKRGNNPGSFQGTELTFWLSGTNGLGQGFGTNRLKIGANSMNTMVSADPRAYVPNLVGKWTHFAITYPGGNPVADFSIYLNGEKLKLGGGPFDFTPNNLQNAIGRYTPAATFQMDDFRVYNRALTDAEVASLSQPSTPVPPPNITSHPVTGSANAGAPFTFNVSATGPDLFYEWFRGTNLLANFDGPTLTIPSTTPSDAGDYRVTISNGGGSTNSLTGTLTVNAAVDPFVTLGRDGRPHRSRGRARCRPGRRRLQEPRRIRLRHRPHLRRRASPVHPRNVLRERSRVSHPHVHPTAEPRLGPGPRPHLSNARLQHGHPSHPGRYRDRRRFRHRHRPERPLHDHRVRPVLPDRDGPLITR